MRIERATTIGRPPAEVYAFVSDPANLPAWQSTISEVRRGEEPIAVGSHFREMRRFAGTHHESSVEVTELEPPSLFALRVTSGPVPFSVRHTFEEVDGSTRMTIALEGTPRGAMRLVAAAMARAVEHTLEGDLARLTALLEQGSPPPSS